jgi:hypothetical protein
VSPHRLVRSAALLAVGSLPIALFATTAAAFDGPTIEARGGLGLGAMLSDAQREQGFKGGMVPSLYPALRVSEMVAAELALSSWFFPRDGGAGRASLFGGGVRVDPRLTDWLSFFVDGHAGVALTGPANRFMADMGTGFEVWLRHNLAVGPFVRYGQVVDDGPDPRFWAAGLFATMTLASAADEPPSLGPSDSDREQRQREWERTRNQSPRLRDRDRDGVVDERDICPDEPQGRNGDPNMLGCPRPQPSSTRPTPSILAAPEPDMDGDGVPDADDKCPRRAFGPNPDPLELGCPLSDRDQDGVPDLYDACPNKAGAADSRPKMNGCPTGRERRRR